MQEHHLTNKNITFRFPAETGIWHGISGVQNFSRILKKKCTALLKVAHQLQKK